MLYAPEGPYREVTSIRNIAASMVVVTTFRYMVEMARMHSHHTHLRLCACLAYVRTAGIQVYSTLRTTLQYLRRVFPGSHYATGPTYEIPVVKAYAIWRTSISHNHPQRWVPTVRDCLPGLTVECLILQAPLHSLMHEWY